MNSSERKSNDEQDEKAERPNNKLITDSKGAKQAKRRSTKKKKSSPDFVTELDENDVLLGRGAPVIHHVGNIRFRDLVQSRKMEYSQAQRRSDKHTIARQIYQEVESRGGKFVNRVATLEGRKRLGAPENAAVWVIVDKAMAVEKCKQTLREKLYVRADKAALDSPPSPGFQSESAPTSSSEDPRRASSAPFNVPQPNWGVLPATRTDQKPFSYGSVPSVGQGRQLASLFGSRFDQMALFAQTQHDHSTAAFAYQQQLTSGPQHVNNGHMLTLLQNVLDRDLQRIRDIGSFPPQQHHRTTPGSSIDPLAEDMLRRHESGRAIRLRQKLKFLKQQAMHRLPETTLPHPSFGPRHLCAPAGSNAFGSFPHAMPILAGAAGLCASHHFQPPSGLREIDSRILALLQRQNQQSLLATATAAGIPSLQSHPAANDASTSGKRELQRQDEQQATNQASRRKADADPCKQVLRSPENSAEASKPPAKKKAQVFGRR